MVEYYVAEILSKSLMSALSPTEETGPPLITKMLSGKSRAILQQDCAAARHSKKAQNWCSDNLDTFWGKGTWPANSPDLSHIENL
uniref:Uncharacterized protein n=1 Tax=Lepeophtheirus salmonis TaxID=72036 RepID=A0A0K2VFG6_LEPSM